MRVLIYDIEIVKAIPPKHSAERLDDIAYCAGWHDHANMGVACVCAYDYLEDRYRVFMADNLGEFYALAHARDVLVGFNSIAFDNSVLAHALPADLRADLWEPSLRSPADVKAYLDGKAYDLLVALWEAAGLGPQYRHPTHAGFGLDAVCAANFGTRKSGHGAQAPIDHQRGRHGAVIDYCLNDVRLTKQVFDAVRRQGYLRDPRDPGETLMITLASPFGADPAPVVAAEPYARPVGAGG